MKLQKLHYNLNKKLLGNGLWLLYFKPLRFYNYTEDEVTVTFLGQTKHSLNIVVKTWKKDYSQLFFKSCRVKADKTPLTFEREWMKIMMKLIDMLAFSSLAEGKLS